MVCFSSFCSFKLHIASSKNRWFGVILILVVYGGSWLGRETLLASVYWSIDNVPRYGPCHPVRN